MRVTLPPLRTPLCVPSGVCLPASRSDRAARPCAKALADNCVEIIGDMTKDGRDVLDFGFLFGYPTDGMSDEDARLAIDDLLFIPEVTPLWPRLEPTF